MLYFYKSGHFEAMGPPSTSLFETSLEVHAVDVSSLHSLLYIHFEGSSVALELCRGLLVQRILRVGLQKEILESVDDGVDGEDRLPILAQNVETNITLQVNVGVVNLRLTFHLGRFMGVGVSYLETEGKLSMSIKALIRKNDELEVEEIICVRELCFAGFGKLQLVDIFGYPELSGAGFFLSSPSRAFLPFLLF